MKKRLKILYFFLIIIVLFCYLFYDQAFDMKITMLHASDLLDCIFSGKGNFYQITLEKSLNGEYIRPPGIVCGAIYHIAVYLVMAVIAIPIYLFRNLMEYQTFAECLNIWGRVVTFVLTIYAGKLITDMAGDLDVKIEKEWIRFLFFSSPVVLFSVVIFNQYDIFSVLFTLLGIKAYFQGRNKKFLAWFGIAVCFKLFALFVFIPLVLLREKKWGRIVGNLLTGVSLYAVSTVALIILDEGYLRTQKLMLPEFGFFESVTAASLTGAKAEISLFVLGYLLVCFYAYSKKLEGKLKNKTVVWLAFAVYGLFFVFVDWHPQWVLVLVPYMLLTVCMQEDYRLALLLETLVCAGYILINMVRYLDASILCESLLAKRLHYSVPSDMRLFLLFQKLGDQGVFLSLVMTIFVFSIGALAYMGRKSLENQELLLSEETERSWNMFLIMRMLLILLYALPPVLECLVFSK